MTVANAGADYFAVQKCSIARLTTPAKEKPSKGPFNVFLIKDETALKWRA